MDGQELKSRLEAVRQTLRDATDGRWPVPRLVAVTKTHAPEEILPLRALGVDEIGENRVQEITAKLPDLEAGCGAMKMQNFRVHLIGRLQSNKVKYIIDKVCLIQSLDRMSLAREIDRQAQSHGLVMPCLVQVSPAGEAQKGGMPPEDVPAFLKEAARMPGIRIDGLMAVMPLTDDQAYLTGLFRGMRTLFDTLREERPAGVNMEVLSMGMSGDYALAARCGATMVRVGSAIFGHRDQTVRGY